MIHFLALIFTCFLLIARAVYAFFLLCSGWPYALIGMSEVVSVTLGTYGIFAARYVDVSWRSLCVTLVYVTSLLFITGSEVKIWPLYVGGAVLSFVSLVYLGASYSVGRLHVAGSIVEAGPYRYIRHPQALARMAMHVSSLSIVGIVGIVAVLGTTLIENSFLNRVPGYSEYAARTGFLFPRRGRS